jgi:hypothetical protein
MKILFWTVKLLIKVKRKGCLLRFGVKRRNWLAQGDLNSSKRPHNNCKKFNENHLKRASMWGNTSSQIQLNSKREYTTIINPKKKYTTIINKRWYQRMETIRTTRNCRRDQGTPYLLLLCAFPESLNNNVLFFFSYVDIWPWKCNWYIY